MIEIRGLTKRYGDKTVVDHISFAISPGEVVGFLGRNGAGKSTTMNMITGYISASEGTVTLDGLDVLDEPRAYKRRIGYLPEQPPLYMDMTVDEYLKFVCAIKGVNRRAAKAHLEEIAGLVKIQDVWERLIKNLSKGYRQRVGIAQALVGDPEVIILDEPTAGLDPMQIIEIRSLIKRLRERHTLVLSSHILHEVADVCDRVIIIDGGKIVAQDNLAALTAGATADRMRMVARIAGDAPLLLEAMPGVYAVEPLGMQEEGTLDFVITIDKAIETRKQLSMALAQANAPLLMLRPMDVSLEDVFIRATSARQEVV